MNNPRFYSGITPEQHCKLVEQNGRPATQDPIYNHSAGNPDYRTAATPEPAAGGGTSLEDAVWSEHLFGKGYEKIIGSTALAPSENDISSEK